jgi:hypothetical protein
MNYETMGSYHRSAQVVITRMRIGHTHLTHSYYMNHLEPPRCANCDTTLTAPHILHDCCLFGHARAKYRIDVTFSDLHGSGPL